MEFWITGYYDPVGFDMQVVKIPTYPAYANFHFLLHYVITVHKHYRQTDGQTDVMLVA